MRSSRLHLSLLVTAMPAFAGPASDAVRFFYDGSRRRARAGDAATASSIRPRAKFEQNDDDEARPRLLHRLRAVDRRRRTMTSEMLNKTLKLDEDDRSARTRRSPPLSRCFRGYADSERDRSSGLCESVDGEWKVADIEVDDDSSWELSEFDCQ